MLTTILPARRRHGPGARPRRRRRRPALVRTLIGLAGQYAAVDENLTGRENLQMVGNLNHLDRAVVAQRAVELLDQFNLTDAGDRPLKTYSGGMRRRLDLAAALVARPTVLFLDEPTTGLDPQSRNDLWEVIEQLVGGGTTVLLTTQYLEEADRLASTPGRARPRPGHRRGHAGVDEGRPRGHRPRGRAARPSTTPAGPAPSSTPSAPTPPWSTGPWSRSPSTTDPQAAMIGLRALDAEGIAPTTFNLREPSLDDVFLSLTGHRTEEDEDDDADDETSRGRSAAPEDAGRLEQATARRHRRAAR